MAAPWEDTVVMALRDAQWLEDGEGKAPPPPPMFIKLDGTTEQSLGDLIYQVGERFYLFEVKSASTAIRSEWNKLTDGKPRPKVAYVTLSRLARAAAASRAPQNETQALWTSLRCHHLVYWSDELFDPRDTLGNILVEPYIAACIHHGAPRGSDFGQMPYLEIQTAIEAEDDTLLVAPMLPFSALRSRHGLVLIPGSSGNLDVKRMATVGEDLERFREYLKFLVTAGAVGDGSLRAVICSDSGRFVKVITSIDQLSRELRPTADASPKPPQILKRVAHPRPPGLNGLTAGPELTPRPAFPDFSPKPKPPRLSPFRL